MKNLLGSPSTLDTGDILGPAAIVVAALISVIGGSNARERYRKKRCQKFRNDLRDTCPHVEIADVEGEVTIDSLCFAVMDSPLWRCLECGKAFLERQEQQLAQDWSMLTIEEARRQIAERKEAAASLKRKLSKHGCEPTEVS